MSLWGVLLGEQEDLTNAKANYRGEQINKEKIKQDFFFNMKKDPILGYETYDITELIPALYSKGNLTFEQINALTGPDDALYNEITIGRAGIITNHNEPKLLVSIQKVKQAYDQSVKDNNYAAIELNNPKFDIAAMNNLYLTNRPEFVKLDAEYTRLQELQRDSAVAYNKLQHRFNELQMDERLVVEGFVNSLNDKIGPDRHVKRIILDYDTGDYKTFKSNYGFKRWLGVKKFTKNEITDILDSPNEILAKNFAISGNKVKGLLAKTINVFVNERLNKKYNIVL